MIRLVTLLLSFDSSQSSFAGWEDCAGPLLAIVSNADRVKKQLIPFITLIRLLKDQYNCFQGAVRLIRAIDSVILSSENSPELTPAQMNAYFDLCLEEDMTAANPERMSLLGPFCCNYLDTMQQCSLVTHLPVRHSALPFFSELLLSLACNGDFDDSSDIKEHAVELLLCYLDAGLPDPFNELTHKLLNNPQIVKIVLNSSKIWKRAKGLDGGRGRAHLVAALSSFVKMRIATLTDFVEHNRNPSTESFLNVMELDWSEDNQEENRMRISLSLALDFVVRLVDASDSGLTDLEGLAILHPLLSRMSSVRLGQLVVDSLTDKRETSESRSLFSEICGRVRLPHRVEPDTVVGLLRVFSRQGSASEELLNSLVEALLVRSAPPVDPSIFNAVLSRATDWICEESPELMKGVTSKLTTAWIAFVVDKDDVDEAKACIMVLIKLEYRSFLPDVDPAPLLPFITKMTTESLLVLLSHLYLVLDNQSNRSSLDRHLISECLGREDYQMNTLSEAWEMLKCLLWLGDRPCMDSFIRLLSATRQGECLAVQLALCSSFRSDFEELPVHSAGWKIACVLLDHCIEGLGRIWKQTSAVVPGYPGVQNFLHSTSQSMVLDGFDDRMNEAHEFRDELLRQAPARGFSITAHLRVSNGKTARVEITKVKDAAWEAECRNDFFHCEDRQKKLETLVALRKDQPIWEPFMPTETGATGNKRTADPPSQSADTKRQKNFSRSN